MHSVNNILGWIYRIEEVPMRVKLIDFIVMWPVLSSVVLEIYVRILLKNFTLNEERVSAATIKIFNAFYCRWRNNPFLSHLTWRDIFGSASRFRLKIKGKNVEELRTIKVLEYPLYIQNPLKIRFVGSSFDQSGVGTFCSFLEILEKKWTFICFMFILLLIFLEFREIAKRQLQTFWKGWRQWRVTESSPFQFLDSPESAF